MTQRKSSVPSVETISASTPAAGSSPRGVRRSSRIPKELPIVLIGSDMNGRAFTEETRTVVLSRHGAGIISAHKLAPEQELTLRCLSSNKEAEVRVVGQMGSQADRYTYGMAFLDPSVDLWGAEFVSPPPSGQAAGRISLACTICQDYEAIEESDFALDVHAANDGVLRFCRHCQSTTLWKEAVAADEDKPVCSDALPAPQSNVPAVSPPPAAPVSPASSPAPAPPARLQNRRAHVRTKANFMACVRNYDHEDDVVVCENMSRGGLCFKSRRRYYENTLIEVAAPFSPGTPALFVPARIVRVQELPEEKLFRYGAAYINTTRDPRSVF